MLYSFIIPTLNRTQDVGRLLGDITDLTIEPDDSFEVVLFNDGNNAETAKLVLNWSGFPIQYLHSEERVNSCISRNRCIEKALGDWLIFLDDDVRLKPDF